MSKPFRGTIKECLKHFVENNPRLNTVENKELKLRNDICDLLGVHNSTGKSWFTDLAIPLGENLLRLRYFLELNGYQLLERQGITGVLRELSDQVSLRIITPGEAARHIKTTVDVVIGIVIGRDRVSSAREKVIKDLVEARHSQASVKLDEWKDLIKAFGLHQVESAESQSSRYKPSTSPLGDDQVIESLAHMILAMKALAARVESDDFSPQQRARLRELTTNGRSNTVFELSTLLNRLCGERARREL